MIHVSDKDIERYLSDGESETVEFKEKLPSDAAVSRILSAFANTKGGILLIGISENGEIVGVPDQEVNSTIHILSNIIDPMLPLTSRVSAIKVDGKNIVYAAIDKVPQYYGPILTSVGQAFIRQESRTEPVPSTDLYEPNLREKILSVKPVRRIRCFVAMSFRVEEEPHLEDYFRAMKRAALATDLPIDLVRVDLLEGDYEISQKIMDQIDEADLLIADFTLNSRNVYFEVGYARASGKRIIQSTKTGTNLEFDVRNWRTIFYRNATELEEKLVPELKLAYSEVIER